VGGAGTGQRHGDPDGQLRNAVLIVCARGARVLCPGWVLCRASVLCRALVLVACACGAPGSPGHADAAAPAPEPGAAEVAAEPPADVAVTVYRSPARARGSIDVNHLDGFALVTEKRRVRLPAGVSRLRFDGVADGIEAQSAIISGLPAVIIEKNRDEKVLSPAALLAATVGKSVELIRTLGKSGMTERIPGKVLSDAGGGVLFSTADGVEALRCSGLPETFSFEPAGMPAAHASLSVLVRSPAALDVDVTLSYLSRGFDWAADYTATLTADEHELDLGAWVTLANSNGTSFPAAHTQVVAGRVAHEGAVVPVEWSGPIVASCWPRGSTSDVPPLALRIASAASPGTRTATLMAPRMQFVTVTAQRKVTEEQLGDLKLYRVPERTNVSARQSKQVRLLDRAAIPVSVVYRASLDPGEVPSSFAARRVLRTVNDAAHHLGLPLPSGNLSVFASRHGERLLLHEAGMRDLAINEAVEIELGLAPEVQVSLMHDNLDAGPAAAPLPPRAAPRRAAREQSERVEISNARTVPVRIELSLSDDGSEVSRADHPWSRQNGRPTFRVTVPAGKSAVILYRLRYGATARAESVVR